MIMATRNIVPRADNEGKLGTSSKRWTESNFKTGYVEQLIIKDGAGNFVQVPQLTTTQRDALTPVNGMIIYNSTVAKMQKYEAGAWSDMSVSGDGEANTASNVGSAGTGIFKQKVSVDLQFKKINAGSNKVAITDDTGNSKVDIDVNANNVLVASNTDSLAEGSTNKYYTDTRFDNRLATKTTDNIAEGSTNKYYTDSRFDNRLATKTTDNLAEGSTNKYYTDERVDDRVNALLLMSIGLFKTYDDASNTLTLQPTKVVTLTDASTIATDASQGNVFEVTLGGNRTLGNPTNPQGNGQKCIWRIKQDGTGNRTITLDTKFRLGTDIASITLSTGANKTDYFGAIYHSGDDKWDVIAFVKGY